MKNQLNYVNNILELKLGKKRAKMYTESAPMFNAEFETKSLNGYFVESSQFESSTGDRLPREYHLKYIGEHVSKVKQFKSKVEAHKFFNSMEFINGALVLERSNMDLFSGYFMMHVNDKGLTDRLYDNGYTAFYYNKSRFIAASYCEGDIVIFHAEKMEELLKSHLEYFNENEA